MTQNTQAADAFMAIFGMRRVARPTDEQREQLSDEDREWLDMPPIGAEFGASEDD